MLTHHKIRHRNIASEVIEGEAIIVDVETGTYFSANPSGSLLWGALQAQPRTLADLATLLMQLYPSETPERLQSDCQGFIASLEAHGLLVRSEGGNAAPTPVPPAQGAYVAPALEVHTDMRDFLLVDPIHEVSDAGAPEPRDR
jgi:hypothetical protein